MPKLLPRRGSTQLAALLAAATATAAVAGNDMKHAPDCSAGLEALAADMLHPYSGDAPGASLLVLRDGHAVIRRSSGMADREAGVPATPATNYRLASVSKQFTAMAVLLLVQDGRLALDAPVRRWLPSLPPATAAVTLRQLLSHRSGVVDYEDAVADDAPRQLRDADVLALLESEDRTLFPPGSSYRYSNSGFALLALVVERASGDSFQHFLASRIFGPLGMHDTLARVEEGPAVPRRAYGYRREGGGWARRDQSPTSAVLGDGGIYSSVDDLARWDAALYDDRLLGDALRREMFTVQGPTDDPEVGYALGWRRTGTTAWHSGESIGFRNVLVRDASRHVTVIFLSNRDDPEPYPMARRLAACVPP